MTNETQTNIKVENDTATLPNAEVKAEVKVEKSKSEKLKEIKKKQQKANLERFKSQYFDYYDDIKISDRQDW